MKMNEIPEKIHLSYETDDEDDKDHIFIDYMWHRHPFEGKNLKNVEYTRTDAFIEKAYDFIRRKICDYIVHYNYGPNNDMETMYVDSRFFDDFKNYIKGE